MQTRETGHAHRPRPRPARRPLARAVCDPDLRVLNPPGLLPGPTMRRLTLPPGLLASGIAHRAPPHPGHHRHQLGNPSTCRRCARLRSWLGEHPSSSLPICCQGPPMAEPRRKMVGREPGSRRTQIPASATQGGGEQSKWKAEGSRRTTLENAETTHGSDTGARFSTIGVAKLKNVTNGKPRRGCEIGGIASFFFVK